MRSFGCSSQYTYIILLVHHYVSWNLLLSNRCMWSLSVHSTCPSKIKTDWSDIVIHCLLYVLLQYQLSDIINAVKIFISVLSSILLGLMTQYVLTPFPILVCGGFIYFVNGFSVLFLFFFCISVDTQSMWQTSKYSYWMAKHFSGVAVLEGALSIGRANRGKLALTIHCVPKYPNIDVSNIKPH